MFLSVALQYCKALKMIDRNGKGYQKRKNRQKGNFLLKGIKRCMVRTAGSCGFFPSIRFKMRKHYIRNFYIKSMKSIKATFYDFARYM